MKNLLIALSISALTVMGMSSSAYADGHKSGAKHSAKFFKKLDHASFMPNLMKHTKKHKTKFKITDEQMKTLKGYHKQHSPMVKKMVSKLIELEKQAKEMTLDNYPPKAVANVGEQTLKIRHDLMMAKLKCRSFLKSVLKPKQYKDVLTSYK